MTLRSNGSYIGYRQATTTGSVTGIWSINEVFRRESDSNWPQPPATARQTVISVGNGGYYQYNGWLNQVETSTNTVRNFGSATGDKLLLNSDPITGLAGLTNPGRTGFSLYVNGTSGNAGWTRLDAETTFGGTTYTGYIFRADCGYTADSSNLQNWNQRWMNNTHGYSGTHTYYGTSFQVMCAQGSSQPTSGTVTFDFS